jgi:hypothetical protein
MEGKQETKDRALSHIEAANMKVWATKDQVMTEEIAQEITNYLQVVVYTVESLAR